MTNGTPPPTDTHSPDDEILATGDVARLFRADPKTVRRWGNTGRLPYFLTPDGRRRYRRAHVDALLNGQRLHILAMSDAELKAAGDMLARVIGIDWRGPLTGEQARPLLALLRALPGGEAK